MDTNTDTLVNVSRGITATVGPNRPDGTYDITYTWPDGRTATITRTDWNIS